MTVLLDSWTWIEYWKGGKLSKAAAEHIEGDEEAVVSTINISEVYFWVARYYEETTAAEKLKTVEKRCSIVEVDKEIAINAAKIKLESKLGLAESLIMATARQVRAKVVTGDMDMKGLKEVNFLPSG
jgi:predicted nucleic acid-binding protein